MSDVTVTITIGGGTFVYTGTHSDGASNWRFFRPRKDDPSKLRPARVPPHLQRLLKKQRRNPS